MICMRASRARFGTMAVPNDWTRGRYRDPVRHGSDCDGRVDVQRVDGT